MAIQVGLGTSIDKDPLKAAREAAKTARLNLHSENVDLAVVFSSVEFTHTTFLKTIAAVAGTVNIIGSSSFGIITSQAIFKSGIAIMLFSFPETIHFSCACIKDVGPRPAASIGIELADKLSVEFKNVRRNVGVLFSDGLMQDSSGLLDGLRERFGMSFPLAGASSSDNLTFKKTFQYFNTEVLNYAVCGLLLGGRLNFGLGVQHGWKPLGKPRYVTKSSANIVYEIDGAPAAKVYEEYFASDIEKLRKDLRRILAFYPMGIYLPGEQEYLLRSLLFITDSGALVFQGNIPQESEVRLMIGTKESCLAAAGQAADEVKRGLAGRPCNFVFVFESISRYILLGRQINKELGIIKEKLGKDIPIIGIYTYGEQAPLKSIDYHGMVHFHNQTIAILGIGG